MIRVASNLNSAITRGEAHKEFKKLKSQHPELPRSPALLCRMLDLMETYRIQLSVRRYIHGVFERASLRFPQELNGHVRSLSASSMTSQSGDEELPNEPTDLSTDPTPNMQSLWEALDDRRCRLVSAIGSERVADSSTA